MSDLPSTPAMNPAALSVADLARLLSAVGGQPVAVELIQFDLAAGAPSRMPFGGCTREPGDRAGLN